MLGPSCAVSMGTFDVSGVVVTLGECYRWFGCMEVIFIAEFNLSMMYVPSAWTPMLCPLFADSSVVYVICGLTVIEGGGC